MKTIVLYNGKDFTVSRDGVFRLKSAPPKDATVSLVLHPDRDPQCFITVPPVRRTRSRAERKPR